MRAFVPECENPVPDVGDARPLAMQIERTDLVLGNLRECTDPLELIGHAIHLLCGRCSPRYPNRPSRADGP